MVAIRDPTLNVDLFTIVVVILSIIVVGNFRKDCKSNYLEGALLVIVYIIIAVAALYYPILELSHEGASAPDDSSATERRH